MGFHVAQHIAEIFDCRSVALYDAKTGEIFRGGVEDLPGVEEKLKQVVMQGANSRDDRRAGSVRAHRPRRPRHRSLALAGVEFSDGALQALLNLVAIAWERVRTEEAANRADAARQSEEFKSTLLDAIAHEFKTPLTSIKAASTTMLSDAPPLTPQTHELATIIDEEADRLTSLVTEAVRMSQIEAGKVRLDRQRVSLDLLLPAILAQFQARSDGRPLHYSAAPSLPELTVDPALISLALRQLIDNALKYSPPGSPVDISAARSNGNLEIRIADRGPGIPDNERERVFEKFYRRQAVKERVPGTGLGLHIAREILRAHGGDVAIPPGPGSAFCITIPVQLMNTGRILVVDDEPQIRRVLRASLSAQGYEIHEARTGEEALTAVREQRFDLILLDMNMPGLGGLETCRQIRAGSEVAIIMLTVRDSEPDKVAALDAGADDYVTKPFGMPELSARIRAALRRLPTAAESGAESVQLGAIEVNLATRRVISSSRRSPPDAQRIRLAALLAVESQRAHSARPPAASRVGTRLRGSSGIPTSFHQPVTKKDRARPLASLLYPYGTVGWLPFRPARNSDLIPYTILTAGLCLPYGFPDTLYLEIGYGSPFKIGLARSSRRAGIQFKAGDRRAPHRSGGDGERTEDGRGTRVRPGARPLAGDPSGSVSIGLGRSAGFRGISGATLCEDGQGSGGRSCGGYPPRAATRETWSKAS